MSFIDDSSDPNEVIAPSEAAWALMSARERELVVASLGIHVEHDFMSEGDTHAAVVFELTDAMRIHFGSGGSGGRRVYIGRSVMVHYPAVRGFAPDVFVVFDVDDHPRDSWVVSREGKGLDIAIEVLWEGDAGKDYRRNVERYASVGIPEYFVLDRRRMAITGHRLVPGTKTYQPILGQLGRFYSDVLGLWFGVLDGHFRLFSQQAVLPTSGEVMERLGKALVEAQSATAAEAARAAAAVERATAASERATVESERATVHSERAAMEAERAAAEAERAAAEAERADRAEYENRALRARIEALSAQLLQSGAGLPRLPGGGAADPV